MVGVSAGFQQQLHTPSSGLPSWRQMSELFPHPVVGEGIISTFDSKDSGFLSVVVHALLEN